MARFARSEDELNRKIQKLREAQAEKDRRAKIRHKNELKRRRLYASIYEPHACVYESPDGQPCVRYAIPGGFFCIRHGGNTKEARDAAKMRLLALVEPALKALNRAMASGDLSVATKAASVLLDRAGFGPKATLAIEEDKQDLSKMNKQDLIEYGRNIMNRLHEIKENEKQTNAELLALPEVTDDVIDVEVEKEGSVH